MSIDYKAVYGIGFEVEGDADVLDALFHEHEKYRFEQVGNCYTGEDLRSFILFRKDFNELLETIEKEELILGHYLDDNHIEAVSDFGLHGGVLIG